jgi:hypothetical protein
MCEQGPSFVRGFVWADSRDFLAADRYRGRRAEGFTVLRTNCRGGRSWAGWRSRLPFLRPKMPVGLHRLEACKRAGVQFVDCRILEDETDARLWEIAENLHRAELTALEHDEHVAEWIRLTERKLAQIAPVGPARRPREVSGRLTETRRLPGGSARQESAAALARPGVGVAACGRKAGMGGLVL